MWRTAKKLRSRYPWKVSTKFSILSDFHISGSRCCSKTAITSYATYFISSSLIPIYIFIDLLTTLLHNSTMGTVSKDVLPVLIFLIVLVCKQFDITHRHESERMDASGYDKKHQQAPATANINILRYQNALAKIERKVKNSVSPTRPSAFIHWWKWDTKKQLSNIFLLLHLKLCIFSWWIVYSFLYFMFKRTILFLFCAL